MNHSDFNNFLLKKIHKSVQTERGTEQKRLKAKLTVTQESARSFPETFGVVHDSNDVG